MREIFQASRSDCPQRFVQCRERDRMTVSRNEPEGLRHSAESEEFQKLYHELSRILHGVLATRYHLAESEATALLEDAFYAYMQITVPTSDAESWLTAAICTRAEMLYGARVVRATPPDVDSDIAHLREMLSTLRGLETLPDKARTAVRLRVHDQLSYEDIASELDVSVVYARHLVRTSIEKLRALQRKEKS